MLWVQDAAPWKNISLPSGGGLLVLTGFILWMALTGEKWVWILDGANLLFHEAGHPIFGLLSERLMVYGGTLGQLVFPTIVWWKFQRQREVAGTYVSALWFGENWLNIGRYMADARAQVLPLVGNGDRIHDWNEILVRWGLLNADTALGGLVRFMALIGILAATGWLIWRWCNPQENRSSGRYDPRSVL
ncbi:MAG: hypothetical protein P4L87_17980 [Formivibrio sp.]|nr:hypothetical protein [Formivibrio sp.]